MSRTQLTVTITGETDADLDDGLQEIHRQLRDGCTSEFGRNETGSFTWELGPEHDSKADPAAR